MSEKHWECILAVAGDLQAEILRGLLEAQGIPAYLSREGAGRAYGLTVGPLGEVSIMVPSDRLAEAQQVLDQYRQGRFDDEGLEEEPSAGEQPD